MNPKRARFAAEYLIDLNGKQAAIRAGYAPRSAEVTASRLLRDAKVAAAVESGKAKQLAEANVTASRTLQEAARLAYSDIGELFDPDGKLMPLRKWPIHIRAAVSSVKYRKFNEEAGDGKQDDIVELKLWDKPKNLDLLFRHLGMLTDKVEMTISGALEDRIKAGRDKLAKARRGNGHPHA